MRLTWPLMGRAGELGLIDTAVSDSGTAGIVISGAAGVGKSRVAREALEAAAARGYDVRWAVGSSSATNLPLGALASWPGSLGSDGMPLVWRIIDTLGTAAAAAPVVIGVDDAHLLDDMTMFVLHQAVQRRSATLVLTLREGEAVPRGIQDLWTAGEFDWLDLSPLSAAQTQTLLAESLGAPVESETAHRLHRLTGGNPLYLRHIVEQEVAAGRLAVRDRSWAWSGESAVPPSLVELIEARIGALPPAVGMVIDVLAISEPLELAALQRITDADAVEQADVRGLIRVEPRGEALEVRVAHPLYGEVRRHRAAPTRLRRLRSLVAAELAHAHDRDDVRTLVRRAALSLDSDLAPEGELLVRAAQGAVCLADLALAARLAEAAMRVEAGPEARFIRAHALSWLGDGRGSEQVLAEIRAADMTEEQFARFTYLRASNMLWALGEPGRAKEIIDEAAQLTSPAARQCVEAVGAVYRFATDHPADALAAAAGLTLEDLPPVIGAETAWVLTSVRADAGRTAEALAVADAGQAIVRSSDAPQLRFNIAEAQVGALLLAGRIDEAAEIAEHEHRLAADLPGAAPLLGVAVAGRAALGAGRLDRARELFRKAATELSAAGHASGWGFRYRIELAVALAISGSLDEADDVLTALEQVRRPFRPLYVELGVARAWLAAGQGAVSDGIELLRRTAARAAGQGRFAVEVSCLQTAVQFGDRTCDARLLELASVVEGPRVGLAVRLAVALRDDDAAELASVSAAFEELGDRIAAVDAAAHAALAYRRTDRRGSALTWATKAETLAAQCGGAATPALRAAVTPLPLTGREREIVSLLGSGMSNRDIAARLVVSVRTVEGHIYKAMAKTGTASREELAALLR